MAHPTSYTLTGYGQMITDKVRMGPYFKALRQAVRPGCVVVDIGAGTGIFSLLACHMGAGHVHLIEPAESIALARDMAAANGFARRITFYQALSTDVTLPQQADVIISDIRGVLPLLQQHIPAIADARHRFLAQGGTLIPSKDTLWVTLINGPENYRDYAEPWLENEYGLNMKAGHSLAVNVWRKVNARAEQMLLPPRQWAVLDYTAIADPNVSGSLTWTVENPGQAHGLLVWFDAQLLDGIGFSNAPGEPESIYGQAFFPLQEPLALERGDTVTVRLAADLCRGDYIWRWETSVFSPTDPASPRTAYRQSTFFGSPLDLERLQCRAADHVPVLNESGQADSFILSRMDGRRSLIEIARMAEAMYPGCFPRWQDALARAGDLAEKYHQNPAAKPMPKEMKA